MFHFMNFVRPFVNYAIFRELCDRMRFEVDCAKSHHRVISEDVNYALLSLRIHSTKWLMFQRNRRLFICEELIFHWNFRF